MGEYQHPLTFGVVIAQHQYTWPELVSQWKLAEELGFDSIWLFDHFMALYADPDGPCLETSTLLAALAQGALAQSATIVYKCPGNVYTSDRELTAKQAAAFAALVANANQSAVERTLDQMNAEQLRSLAIALATQVNAAENATGEVADVGPDGICAIAIATAAQSFGTTRDAVLSADRHRAVTDARAVAMTAARRGGLTLPAIALALIRSWHPRSARRLRKSAGASGRCRNPDRHRSPRGNLVRNYRRGIHFAHTLKQRGANPKDVLEIGPGRGVFTDLCLEAGAEYQAIEPNREMADQLRNRGVNVVNAIVPPMPEFGGAFDVVVMNSVIEHMNTMVDALELSKQVLGMLRPGGRFVLYAPDYANWRHHFFIGDFSHSYITSWRRLEELLISAGFDRVDGCYQAATFRGIPCFVLSALAAWMPFGWLDVLFPHSRIAHKLYKIQIGLLRRVLIAGIKEGGDIKGLK